MGIDIKLIVTALLVTVVTACTKDTVDASTQQWEPYCIEKGKHKSRNQLAVTTDKEAAYSVVFSESCLYELGTDDQYDINKLFGLSDGLDHTEASVRIGWRTGIEDSIDIFAYTRQNSTIYSEQIGRVAVNSLHSYAVAIEPNRYRFRIDTYTVYMERKNRSRGMVRYRLWPYYGGDRAAPHSLCIMMRKETGK